MTNSREIKELHSILQRGYAELVRRMKEKGFGYMGTSSTYRCHNYQNYLYAQGRTAPGNIVTYAKGGESIHNFRLAFDIYQNIRGKEYEEIFLNTAGKIWTEMGGTWGGNWTGFIDKPHFEYTGGLTLRQLQIGQRLANDAKMPWEREVVIVKPKPEPDPKEVEEVRFNTLNEMPSWAVSTIEKLLRLGILKGKQKINLKIGTNLLNN
ncbi:MAG: M15 family metallopeptidase [Defluviitaleaceae bacterium]|nr:M15 family metallopeptidase [Defluviitaleaceae bacterium]